jgi:hypothetical protein
MTEIDVELVKDWLSWVSPVLCVCVYVYGRMYHPEGTLPLNLTTIRHVIGWPRARGRMCTQGPKTSTGVIVVMPDGSRQVGLTLIG